MSKAKHFIVMLFALQALLTPEVCLMLCCHTAAAQDVQADQAAPKTSGHCHAPAAPEVEAERADEAVGKTNAHQQSQPPFSLTFPCTHQHSEPVVAALLRQSFVQVSDDEMQGESLKALWFAGQSSALSQAPQHFQFHSPPRSQLRLNLRI